MTKPSKTRKTFTRNTFAEHNYNYVHQSKINQPPPPKKKTTQNLNHVCSHYWNFPNTSTNSVNFQENPHPPQDYSENYRFFQQKKRINNRHLNTQIIYHLMMMIIINQTFLHHIHKNIAQKDRDNLNHLKI